MVLLFQLGTQGYEPRMDVEVSDGAVRFAWQIIASSHILLAGERIESELGFRFFDVLPGIIIKWEA